MTLYLLLMLITIAVPMALSFDKKLRFYKRWKYFLPAIVLVAAFYIAFDIKMTEWGVWGFNPKYHSNILVVNLPLEEVLFFLFVPYASLFLHYTITTYIPKFSMGEKVSQLHSIVLIIVIGLLVFINIDKAYTTYAGLSFIGVLLLDTFIGKSQLRTFYLTFLIILIPFLVVNGILTGSFIPGEVVWYNNEENLGIRIFTIPVEDFFYGFSLLYLDLILFEYFERKKWW